MGLHIILFGLVLLLAIGCFAFAMISNHKVFFVGAFIILMLSGFFIQAEQGIVIDREITGTDASGDFIYSDVEFSTSEPSVNLFSWLLVLVGGALTAYSAFVFVFNDERESSFHY